jgi:GNAT superfamily N-acetyltransferase
VTVREAAPGDAEGVAALLAELGYPDDPGRVGRRLQRFSAEPSSFVLVAEDGAGRVAGLTSASVMPLLHEEGRWCRLSALVVGGRSRREGVGRALVAAVEERAREAECRYLEVTSGERRERKAAHVFYAALGLEEVSRRFLKEL